jgi:hypothetical protein
MKPKVIAMGVASPLRFKSLAYLIWKFTTLSRLLKKAQIKLPTLWRFARTVIVVAIIRVTVRNTLLRFTEKSPG